MHMSHRLTMAALVTQKSQNSTFFMVKWQKKTIFLVYSKNSLYLCSRKDKLLYIIKYSVLWHMHVKIVSFVRTTTQNPNPR